MTQLNQLAPPQFDESLFTVGGTTVTLASVVTAAIILAATWVVSKILQRIMTGIYQRRSVGAGVQYALNRLLHYVILAFGVFAALDNLGFSMTALAGIGAILAVGIGFGLQNIAQN